LGLYVEREAENNADQMVNGIQVTSPQKAEQIVRATEEFNKKIDRKGSREIKKAFADWFKTL
jgi:vacuolar-type H+-ATPase subunit E/Vma4